MMRQRRSRRKFLSIAAALAGSTALGNAPALASSGEFTFGLTPVFLTSDLDLLSRLRSYLEREMGVPVRLVTRRTYQEITALLVSGQLNSAWICGYPFVSQRARLSLVAVPVWRGAPLYRSYLIAGRERQAISLDELRGDTHAFSDPDSNSGWLMTATALARQNETPARFFSRTLFTWGHRNVVRAVASGLTASGSVDGYVYEVLRENEPALIDGTRVVSMSEPVGFPPVACAAAAANEPRTLRFQAALLRMAKDEDARAVLQMLRLDGFSVEPPSLFDTIAGEVAALRRSAG